MPYFLYILPLHLIIIYTLLYIYVSFYACIEYDSFSVNFVEREGEREKLLAHILYGHQQHIGESRTSHDTFNPLQPVEEIESLECKEEQAINHHDDERIPKVRTSKRAHARKQVVRTVTGQEQLEQIRLQESYCRHRASSHTRSVGEDVDSQSQGKTPQ